MGHRLMMAPVVARHYPGYSARLQRPTMTYRFTSLLAATLALVASLAGCGETLQPEYNIRLIPASGQTPLAMATSVSLEAVGTGLQTTVAVTQGQSPQLSLKGLDPAKADSTVFAVKVIGSQGVIAYGQSPRIRLARTRLSLGVVVQNIGTLTLAPETAVIPRLSEMTVVTSLVREQQASRPVAAPVFLGGATVDVNGRDQPSREVGLYNPYLHAFDFPPVATPAATGTSVWARNDGSIWLFGGKTEGPPSTYNAVVNQFVTYQVLNDMTLGLAATASTPAIGFLRSQAAITEVTTSDGPALFAFGGEFTSPPVAGAPPPVSEILNTVVTVSPGTNVASVYPIPMLAARLGHTATTLPNGTDVLIFGGATISAPVAEIFDPVARTFVALGADAGAPRAGHTVLPLQDGRYFIVGGVGLDGRPILEALIFDPVTRTFLPAALTLQTPRSQAAIFIAGNDLVVCGGLNAGGIAVADAERFDVSTLAPLPALTASARAGARVASMPDGTVLLLGGRAAEGDLGLRPTSLIEVYRPRDLPIIP